MTLVLIDNYDSFTYNLVQFLGELGAEIKVFRNDKITLNELIALAPTHIVISPGPGDPVHDSGISNDAILHFTGKIPVLGVCLGHQAIGAAYGGRVIRASRVMHGKTSRITHTGNDLFAGLPNPLEVMRYHSLIVELASIPPELEVTAVAIDDPTEIHALRHRTDPVWGVQFHPESVLTQRGRELLGNFLGLARAWSRGAGHPSVSP